MNLSVCRDLAEIEREWRRFERIADCTPFQTFDWLALWHRHIGRRQGVRPVIVVGRFNDGDTAFIMPLCLAGGRSGQRLRWLGQNLCDYNAPLLARDFSERVTPERFLAIWRDLQALLQTDPLLRHDWIDFEKLPPTIGAQVNPFTYLRLSPNASGAHLTQLGENWEEFYVAKRSAATRRHDRAKRKHMSARGEIRFKTAADASDARRTLETLMEQKSQSLARRGLADTFARPGHREFFLDLATNPNTRHLIHISRIEIGTAWAAANLGIVFGGCYYYVLASYVDSELARHGPGALHLRELMAYAIGLKLKHFDFTIGDEPYKLRWSDTDFTLYDYSAPVSWRGLPACWICSAQRRLKRFIKQTPLLWRAVSRVRVAIGAFS